MMLTLALLCVAGWLALAALAVGIARKPAGTTIVYAASLAIAVLAFLAGIAHLLGAARRSP